MYRSKSGLTTEAPSAEIRILSKNFSELRVLSVSVVNIFFVYILVAALPR